MRIAVITGASAGIGKEIVTAVDKALSFDELWVIARRKDRLEELKSLCSTPVRSIALDLTDEDCIREYQAFLTVEKPDIGLLVNAAGCGVFGPFEERDPESLLNSVKLNDLALTAMCSASLPYMGEGSAIVNLGSNSAWQPVPWQAVYGASKSYVLNFSRALGRELKKRGIHVMCVCPGWIKTEFQQKADHDRYMRYVDRWYEASEVADQALKDLAKRRTVSILGAPVRRQVRLVKFLPVKLVMNIWCRQQGIE